MKQGIMKKIMATGLCVAMIATVVGCGKQQSTSGGKDALMNAFIGLNNKAEISFVQTSMDDMETHNAEVAEISFVYQSKGGETMLNGEYDGEHHLVYSVGTSYFTLQADGKQYVRDITATDDLRTYSTWAKGYVAFENFSNIALEGNSNVDNILCQRYHGTSENNGFFKFAGYETIEQTVYVRTDTNSVYYIEEKYVDADSLVNPVIVQFKYFDDTNIVCPSAIANAMTQDEYVDTTTGLVVMDDLETTVQERLEEGYYYADGMYAESPTYTQSWEYRNSTSEVMFFYDFDTDTYTNNLTGEVIKEYSEQVLGELGEDFEIDDSYEIGLPNYLTYGGSDIKNKTLPQLYTALLNQNEQSVAEYYDINHIIYNDPNYTWSEEQIKAVEEYANTKTIKDILADAENWANLDDDTKAILVIVVRGLNGCVENINGSYRDLWSLVSAYANIDGDVANNLENAYEYREQSTED